jgi:hypothetical protein
MSLMPLKTNSIFDWLKSDTGTGLIQVLGAGVGAKGAYDSAEAQKQMYAFQAQLARNNAVLEDAMASDASRRGETNVQNVQLKTAALKSDQRAAMAANGIDMANSGTSADILGTTDYMGARDAITAKHNADMEAWAYQNKAIADRNNANMYSNTSDSISPFMSAGTSLLTSAASYAKNYNAMKTAKGG